MKLNPVIKNIKESNLIKESTSDTTWYVRIGGDDSKDGLSEENAFATIGKALSEIYKTRFIRHHYIINVGVGTFNEYIKISNLIFDTDIEISIIGKNGNASVATGSNSGTFTSGDNYSATDLGQSWTINDLQGKFVLVDGMRYVIKSNTATSLYIPGYNIEGFSGKVYSIQEPTTIIDPPIGSTAAIRVDNIYGSGDIFKFYNMKIQNTNGVPIGISMEYIDYIKLDVMQINGNFFYGIFGNNIDLILDQIYIKDALIYNCYGNLLSGMNCLGMVVKNSGSTGILLKNCVSIDRLAIASYDNGSNGIELNNISNVKPDYNSIESSDNTDHGIFINKSNLVEGNNWYTGSGNGDYGIYVDSSSYVVIDNITNITGTNGDLKLGKFTISWSDFVSDGWIESNLTRMSYVERIDA